jgi:hypothetical protein
MRLVLFPAFATATFAQSVEIDGVHLPHVFAGKLLVPSETQPARPYLIGRKLEILLGRPLQLVAEASSSHPNYGYPHSTIFIQHVIYHWEVTILLKWTFNSHYFVRPFATVGVSFEHGLFDSAPLSVSDSTLPTGTPPASFSTNNQRQLLAGLRF